MLYIARVALQMSNTDEYLNKERLRIALETFCERNAITFAHLRSIIFSQTDDIDFLNPAAYMRSIQNLKNIALFCTKEPCYPQSVQYIVRMLIFFSHIFPWKKVKSVYMFGAEMLRPDIY